MSTLTQPGSRVPTPLVDFQHDIPLVAALRGGYVGSVHRGTACFVGADGRQILEFGDSRQHVFMRSAAKPFQVMPAILSGAIDRFGLTEHELAVLCASHHGEPHHIEAVLGALQKGGLSEDLLACGVHPPIHGPSASERSLRGLEPTAVCNNCSGAHAGMLLACQAMGWDLHGYGDPEHPLQRMTRRVLGRFADLPPASIEFAIDNCAVPAFRLPLRSAARAFATLACPAALRPDEREAAARVVHAMAAHPEMVGGTDAFDTRLMRAAGSALVSKGGAEGFQGVGMVERGLGMALKITDGASRAVPPATVRLLRRVDGLDTSALRALEHDEETHVRNMRGEIVGSLVPLLSERGE